MDRFVKRIRKETEEENVSRNENVSQISNSNEGEKSDENLEVVDPDDPEQDPQSQEPDNTEKRGTKRKFNNGLGKYSLKDKRDLGQLVLKFKESDVANEKTHYNPKKKSGSL